MAPVDSTPHDHRSGSPVNLDGCADCLTNKAPDYCNNNFDGHDYPDAGSASYQTCVYINVCCFDWNLGGPAFYHGIPNPFHQRRLLTVICGDYRVVTLALSGERAW